MGKYICTECGEDEDELYKDFKAGIIKICHCRHCSKVIDKYIETDTMIILLDLILHKLQAYRHVLFNSKVKFHIKFLLVLLVCETYNKWAMLHKDQEADGELVVVYAALEWSFYKMSVVTAIETFSFFATLSVLLYLTQMKSTSCKVSIIEVLKGISISTFGKLLVIPAIIWGQSSSSVYVWLTRLFVFTSNVQALRVLCSHPHLVCMAMIGICYGVQYSTSNFMRDLIT